MIFLKVGGGIFNDFSLILGWTPNSLAKKKADTQSHTPVSFSPLCPYIWLGDGMKHSGPQADAYEMSYGEIWSSGGSVKNPGIAHKHHISAFQPDIFESWFLFDSLNRSRDLFSIQKKSTRERENIGHNSSFRFSASSLQSGKPHPNPRPLLVTPPASSFCEICHSL